MKITSERANGIKTGYWTAAKNDDLVQKLERLNDFDQAQSRKLLVKLQKAQTELDEMKRSGWISVDDRLDWLDPEIEVPPDDGAVLGIVNGVINGIEHQNAVSLVCHDRGEWWMFDRPDIDVKVDWWRPLPELPKEDEV